MSAYPFDQTSLFCSDLKDKDNVEIVKGDICDENLLSNLMRTEKIDIVFHLAAYADVAATIYNPDEDFRTNVVGTYTVLKASKDANVERFVFASSASVYGDQPWRNSRPPKFKEDLKPNPLSTYANSKLWGENEAILFHKLYNLNAVALRYFSIYGPMQIPKPKSHSWVIAIFLMKALKGKPLTVYGGNQVRDFIYVEDVAEATVRASESKEAQGQIINVGTGVPTRIIDLAEMIRELLHDTLNINIKIEVLNYRPKGDPLGGYADTSKMESLLGFKPRTPLIQGIRKSLEWYNDHKEFIPKWI